MGAAFGSAVCPGDGQKAQAVSETKKIKQPSSDAGTTKAPSKGVVKKTSNKRTDPAFRTLVAISVFGLNVAAAHLIYLWGTKVGSCVRFEGIAC